MTNIQPRKITQQELEAFNSTGQWAEWICDYCGIKGLTKDQQARMAATLALMQNIVIKKAKLANLTFSGEKQ